MKLIAPPACTDPDDPAAAAPDGRPSHPAAILVTPLLHASEIGRLGDRSDRALGRARQRKNSIR
jgi:hypothetical protein